MRETRALGGGDFSETHKVCKINWYGLFISVEGSMDFSMIPRNLSFLNLYAQRLEGYVSRIVLSARMQLFCIEECDFSGTIEMEHFPRSLQVFKSHDNSIEALTKLRNLPESMETFELREPNVPHTSVYFGKLPAGRFSVSIGKCKLSEITFAEVEDKARIVIDLEYRDEFLF